MDFVHQSYKPGDTIAAIATPHGEGGVAIIRVSGDHAIDVAEKVFNGPVRQYATHTAHFGKIHNIAGQVVDEVLVLVMLGKRSFTGEDTVEIHCHGGSIITRKVLEVVVQAGARAALPGEFSFKAFINGKIDLSQAEAIQELICAKNERALDAASQQLHGALTRKIKAFQEQLTVIAAILEAWVDFPEEGLEFASMEEICEDLQKVIDEMQHLADTFQDGRIVQEGISVCLVGSPNAGKSSLMNALLEKERAIVSQIPGTTRDLLDDYLKINGLNLRLIDTAGIRESSEVIEQEGIRRSKAAMQKADLVLMVLDGSEPLTSQEEQIFQSLPPEQSILVWNKMDLPQFKMSSLPFPHQVSISAQQKLGIDLLKAKIDQVIWKNGPPSFEEVLITNVRHYQALMSAIASSKALKRGLLSGVSPEFLTIETRETLSSLGKIIGTNITEDVLSAIFSKFCIGK